ncbi:MAG: hypothetical protein NT062_28250 [Proteobacteria bacterium]|nr:hypothetical protein [Pseudomonadota bacterium]
MDFVFMLTRADQTVPDALEVLEEIRPLGLGHVGFKDVGVPPATLRALVTEIRATGAITYMEVVSTSRETALASAHIARDIGVERLLGGTQVVEILDILRGSATSYHPFPGKPVGHPTKLGGTAADVAADCARFAALGCAGVDLLAYRATEADPLDLVRAARAATPGYLLVAGSVTSAAQIRALAEAGADAFTIGSAAFDGSFSPFMGSLRSQLRAILDACR